MNNNGSRLLFVDSAKGVGIILIVIGHMLYDSSHDFLNQLIYSFHVPLFFISAGFVFTYHDTSKLRFIERKAKRLILPFFGFSLLVAKREYEAIIAGKAFEDLIKQVLYVDGKIFFNAPLWFLIIMFEVYIVESIIDNRSQLFHYFFTGFLLTIGFIVSENLGVGALNYFGFNRMIVCLVFFEVGVIGRRLYDEYMRNILFRRDGGGPTAYSYLLFVAISTFWYVLSKANGKVAIYSMVLGNYVIFIICGILGSMSVMIFCKKFFDNDNLLVKLSKYSILILGLQYYFIDPYREKMRELALNRTLMYDVGMVIMTVCIIVGLPAIYNILNKRVSSKTRVLLA